MPDEPPKFGGVAATVRCAMLGLGFVMLLPPDGCAGVGARLPVPVEFCGNPGELAVPLAPFGAPGGSIPRM